MPVTWAATGTSAALTCPSGWQSWNTSTSTTAGQTLTIQAVASGATTIQVCTADSIAYPPAGWSMPSGATLNQAGIDQLRAQYRQEDEQTCQRRSRARTRARELLLSVLTQDQADSYRTHGWFVVLGSAGGWYRIRNEGQAGNVDELTEDGHRTATWCCHPPGGLPDADAHLAQLLHLETDEPGFRATGNRTPCRPQIIAQAA